MPRDCRVSSEESSPRPRELITEKQAARVSRRLGRPRLLPRGRSAAARPGAPGAPGRPHLHPHRAPPGAGCKRAARGAFQLETPPSLSFPCLSSLCFVFLFKVELISALGCGMLKRSLLQSRCFLQLPVSLVLLKVHLWTLGSFFFSCCKSVLFKNYSFGKHAL